MLDEYKNGQPVIYQILNNAIKKDKISHAYLFETRGFSHGLDLALAFAKSLLCPSKYTDNTNCGNCTQCKTIDNGNFTEIKIINPIGLTIKKEQLIELQEEFSKKALIGTKKIYIINNAECLNSASANSILKFLEEPEENIIAILITDNANQIINTILSRCQLISLTPKNFENINIEIKNETVYKVGMVLENNENDLRNFVDDDNSINKINYIIDFIEKLENRLDDILLYNDKWWFEHFNDKEKCVWAFNVLILFYKDIFNHKCNRDIEIFNEYEELIKKISDTNSLNLICFKLNKFMQTKNKISTNVNLNLLMDKLIIDIKGGI